jgi:predicted DsbA family dithiol-disulfide isomerase
VTVDVFSDVVCPWCFIGKSRLEKAIALTPEIPVEVRYQPYFLNPWVPRAGISRDEYLTQKFGSPANYEQIAQRVALAAKAEGLTYNVGALARQPNTIDCHRLIQWAQAAGRGPQMKQRLMELYFTDGGDLSDREVLVQAATDCGMNAEQVRELLATDQDVEEISKAAEAASNAGIQGVPFFIISGKYGLAGAQAPEQLAAALEPFAHESSTGGAEGQDELRSDVS